jgi:non-ribosomal peptide synthetase component F
VATGACVAAYNIPAGLHLRGELDQAALQASFQALVARHESLRTVFDGSMARPCSASCQPCVQPPALRPRGPGARRGGRAPRRRSAAPFDLRQGPLLRVTLARLDDEEHQLWVTLHHIVADGWSLNILLDEFARLYAAAQGPGQLPAATGLRRLRHLAAPVAGRRRSARQLDYWKNTWAMSCRCSTCAPTSPAPASSTTAQRLSLKVPAKLAAALKDLARDQQASLFMVLLAGWQALLHRYSGQGDIRVGVPNANRPRLETQGMVGFFINTQVLRAELDGRLPFAQLLAQVRQATLDAQAHQDLPFEQLVEALPQAREQGLFQVMFNHQQRDLSALRRCRACWPKSCRGTAAKPSSTCNCTARKTTRAA